MISKIITIPFSDNFIVALANLIEDDYLKESKDLSRLQIVFGGHRPALFLKKELSRRIKTAFYPPKIITIDELMLSIAPNRRMMSDLDHCFLIYQLAIKHAPQILQGRDGFVHFLPWAREIIHFLEQLDLENTPQDALRGLKAQASIGFDVPQDINKLLHSLFILREQYHIYLDQQALTTRGYRYYQASQLVAQQNMDHVDTILFCNFFYLHRTENLVIKDLFMRNKASLIMQGDQRRWPALRRIADTFGQDIKEGDVVKEPAFNLNLYAAFDAHTQAGIVATILDKIKDVENAVIVLPDPDAMLPLLSTLPKQIKNFNVALGYPFRRSAIYMLLDFICVAQNNCKDDGYYSKDYLKVMHHPLVRSLQLRGNSGIVPTYIKMLEDCLTGVNHTKITGLLFIRIEDIESDTLFWEMLQERLVSQNIQIHLIELKNLVNSLHDSLIATWGNIKTFGDLAKTIEKFSAYLNAHATLKKYALNEHVGLRLLDIAGEWADVSIKDEPFATLDLLKIMQERLGREMVAFKGSPLVGLQVLGLIETRSLSFDHAIVVDVNEGVLPNLNIYEPLIPREVMIGLNIDRLELEEEIQRYQFMRLISSAKEVHLIYKDRPEKARSRFVEELIWKEEQKQQRTHISAITRPAFHIHVSPHERHATKSKDIVNFLKEFTFSASSINVYKRNPYEFYQNYVLGLKPKEDLLDDPQSRHVGTFVHEILEEAFKPYVGDLKKADVSFQHTLMRLFEERFDVHFGHGQRTDAFLLKVVLENRMRRFLELESVRMRQDVDKILFIERKFLDTLDLPCGKVKFSLRMDRVETLKNGTILVIDYKTGNVDDTSIQMPLYLNYLHKQYPENVINAAYYMLKTQELNMYISSRNARSLDDILGEFLVELNQMMVEIFNEEIPFIDTGDHIR